MNALYEETKLTPLQVARESGYRDWSSQPSLFKRYPDFLFRYKFDENAVLDVIKYARVVTSTKIIGAKPYHQLNTPSAGNLHPVELYVQIRGVRGVLSGIYHVDAQNGELVLIQEIESDGLESHVGLEKLLYGMVFIITTVPFRAEWKYGKRGVRYCYLDVGHQVSALDASLKLQEHTMTILSDFDKSALNELLGFRAQEFVCSVSYFGEFKKSAAAPLKKKLISVCPISVCPTDYSELQNADVQEIAKREVLKSVVTQTNLNIEKKNILSRRSARAFEAEANLSVQEFNAILEEINRVHYPLVAHLVYLADEHLSSGVYLQNRLQKEGSFKKEMLAFLVDQKFLLNADIIVVLSAKYFSANTLMQAGAAMHNLYMLSEIKGFGCSGIGAFYDSKIQNFLQIDNYILYVGALGVIKS